MYLIEFLVKFFSNKKASPVSSKMYDDEEEQLEDINTCKHMFLPIDSTKKVYACSKCGYVISKKDFDDKRNIFKKSPRRQ